MIRARANDIWSIDDLELELRQLPGVRAAGFDQSEDMLLVQLHISDPSPGGRPDQPVPIPVSASRIAARHSDRPVAVEVVRWRSAPALETREATAPSTAPAPTSSDDAPESYERSRARLLAVLAFPDTDELEVHLVLDGRRTIGRAPVSRGAEGAVEATLDAIRDLGTVVHARMRWARAIDTANGGDDNGRQTVAVALEGVDARSPVHYGLAAGTSLIDAAARSTLDALNRHLGRER